MSRKRKPDQAAAEGVDLERDVYCALQAMGWIVPDNERDVESAQAALAEGAVSLPDTLRDSKAVLAGDGDWGSAGAGPIAFPSDVDVEQNLARAAREGGPIPPQIEQIMRKDRLAAERELDGTDDGEDVR